MKVDDLTGAQLDYWVAKAEDMPIAGIVGDAVFIHGEPSPWIFRPSVDRARGGPIIERERITVQASQAGDWRAFIGDGTTNAGTGRRHTDPMVSSRGETPLVAAMRAYVASKLGEVSDMSHTLIGNSLR